MPEKNNKKYNIAFFGSSDFSVIILEKLKENGFAPSLIITVEDKPKGRKLILSPTPVKVWAKQNTTEVMEPSNLKDKKLAKELEKRKFDVFIVASYGKIIPKEIIEIPKRKTLNIHPSLLPKLRGPSPIQTAILKEKETGTTIIVLDELMDHGPIITQEKLETEEWPIKARELEILLAQKSAELLIKILPDWIGGKIKEIPQNENLVTFSKKIEKKDAHLDLNDSPQENYKKILAFNIWPKTYFFKEKNGQKIRVVITEAMLENNELLIKKVIPEGRKEIDYQKFLRNLNS